MECPGTALIGCPARPLIPRYRARKPDIASRIVGCQRNGAYRMVPGQISIALPSTRSRTQRSDIGFAREVRQVRRFPDAAREVDMRVYGVVFSDCRVHRARPRVPYLRLPDADLLA